MEKEPQEQPPAEDQPSSEDIPPPFQPDYDLITVLERGGKEEERFRQEVADHQSLGETKKRK